MRKALSIALILVFLFNAAGYYAVYWCLSYHANIEMDHRLDSSAYSQDDVVTTKIPFSIPYYFDRTDYERLEGSYELNGEFFKLVKQKFEHDTLYVLSVKDHKKKKLFNSMVDFVKLSNDLPSSQQAIKLLNGLIKDYAPVSSCEITSPDKGLIIAPFQRQLFKLLKQFALVFSPPPEIIY